VYDASSHPGYLVKRRNERREEWGKERKEKRRGASTATSCGVLPLAHPREEKAKKKRTGEGRPHLLCTHPSKSAPANIGGKREDEKGGTRAVDDPPP